MKNLKLFVSIFIITICGLFVFIDGVIAEEKADLNNTIDLNSSNIFGISSSYKYTGKAIRPLVTVKYGDKTLINGTDYNVQYGANINAGTGTVTIKGNDPYNLGVTKFFTITKVNNTMSVTTKNKKIKYKKVKKKSQAVSAINVSKAQGNVKYAKVSGNKKITINKRTGKITVKKKIKKGSYKIKVKVTASGNNNYNSSSKTVIIKIKVK